MDNSYELPEGYEMAEGKVRNIKSGKAIVNAVPIPVKYGKKIDYQTGTEDEYIDVCYFINDGFDDGRYRYRVKDIMSGDLTKKLPLLVVPEPRCRDLVNEIFRYSILQGLKNLSPENEEKFPQGWHSGTYHWEEGTKMVPEDAKYRNAAYAADLMLEGSLPINSTLLGAVHGVLMGTLIAAEIRHNYTTVLEGESGVGKSDIADLADTGITGMKEPLTADRKELLALGSRIRDISLILDDYNMAESNRTKEYVKRNASEIIQASSDTVKLNLGKKGGSIGTAVHIIMTSENEFKNASTFNRIYRVKVKMPLPPKLYEKMMEYQGERMLFFIQTIIMFVELDYNRIVGRISADYKLFLDESRKNFKNNRIANTIAVQKTVKKIVVSCYKYMGFDEKIVSGLDTILENGINSVGREMCDCIEAQKGNANNMETARRLSLLIESLGNGYRLAKDEQQYESKKFDGKTIGFCVKEGYLSFDRNAIVELINSQMSDGEEEMSGDKLTKALDALHLLHKDSDNKMCSRMGTKRRMYHVHVFRLLELCNEDLYESIDWLQRDLEDRLRRYF